MDLITVDTTRRLEGLVVGLALACLHPTAAVAQLTITEVMSSATLLGPEGTARHSDWWELTNFGTNKIDLSGYEFTDSGGAPRISDCFAGLLIRPDESVIFVQRDAAATEQAAEQTFRAWWGAALEPGVQLRFYTNPGLSSSGDEVNLKDHAGRLVDSARFGEALSGVSFTTDPECGAFGHFSELGERGARRAETADDVGSPGIHPDPILLRIDTPPTDVVDLCAGRDAIFCVEACGLPPPRYQWFFNGQPIAGESEACLTVPNAQLQNEGDYRVRIYTGLEQFESPSVRLTVDTNQSAPRLLSPLVDLERFEGERATFVAQMCAFPLASFQWYTNGTAVPGASDRTLQIDNINIEMSGTEIEVAMSNSLGWTNASATLQVYARPRLRITEVMPIPDTNGVCGLHENWFELTNVGTNTVKLRMLKHFDRDSADAAKTVNHPGELAPGESGVFVEKMTPQAFVDWWGGAMCPPT